MADESAPSRIATSEEKAEREAAIIELYHMGELDPVQRAAIEDLAAMGELDLGEKTVERPDFRREAMAEIASEVGPIKAFLVSGGKGLMNIMEGVGIENPIPETGVYDALAEQKPYITTAGEIVGESELFMGPAMAASFAASLPLRAAASGLIGGVEGAIIQRGRGEDALQGGAVGAGVGISAEIFIPVLGRLGRKILQRVTGRMPAGAMLDAAGNPTPELQEALDAAGMSFDDLTQDAVDVISKKPGKIEEVMSRQGKAEPEQVARAARFADEGIPATRGEITKDFKQIATEQRLIESTHDTAAEPLRQFKLKQSEAIKSNLRDKLGFDVTKEETGGLMQEALSGRKKLLRTQKNGLYEQATEAAKEYGDVPIFIDTLKESIPDESLFEDLAITAPQGMKSLDQILTKYGIKEPTEEALEAGFTPTPLTVENFERFRKTLNAIERGDQTGAVSVATVKIKQALDDELTNLVEILEKRTGFKEYKGKLIDIDRLRTEADSNSKLIGFIKERIKSESAKGVGPDTAAMAKALNDRGVPAMKQVSEGKKAFADRIESDYKRILKSDPILKTPSQPAIPDPRLKELSDRNAEITEIIDQSSSKIPTEVIDKVLEPLKEARKTVRTLKTEFSPQSIIGKIIDVKKDGVTQITEASKVYDKLVGKAVPVEDTRKLMKSLTASGEKGKQAIASIQASTMMDLISAGFGTESRQISGVRTFNPIAFRNRLKTIGPDKIKSIFANEKGVLKKLNNIEKIAGEMIPPAGAVPKGSASVLLDLANKLGLVAISSKLPGGALLMEALRKLAAPIKKGLDVRAALKADPEVIPIRTLIENNFPGLAAAFGVPLITESEETEGEE